MTATLAQHRAARNDQDLLARTIAAAEQSGVSNAQQWAEANMGRIVAATAEGTTVADVHAFASANYHPPMRPGEDPASVTDALLIAAVEATRPPE